MGQQVGYIRVSHYGQNTERQLQRVELDETFIDECSGSVRERPGLQACLRHMRNGDTLHVHAIDRLARSLSDLQQLITELVNQGVTVRFHKEGLTFGGETSDAFTTFQMQLLGAVAELERNIIRERQAEGIALAKAKGVYKGRKRALSDTQVKQAIQWRNEGKAMVNIARDLGVSRSALYRSMPEDAARKP